MADEVPPDRLVDAEGAVGESAEGQREPDEEEADEPETEDREVRRHHVRCVLGPAEAGLDEREARLHEDDEGCADDHPEQVDLLAEDRHRLARVLGERRVGAEADNGCGDTQADREFQCFLSHGAEPFSRRGSCCGPAQRWTAR